MSLDLASLRVLMAVVLMLRVPSDSYLHASNSTSAFTPTPSSQPTSPLKNSSDRDSTLTFTVQRRTAYLLTVLPVTVPCSKHTQPGVSQLTWRYRQLSVLEQETTLLQRLPSLPLREEFSSTSSALRFL